LIYRFLRQSKRIFLTFILFWSGGFLVFLSFVPVYVGDTHTKTDAIVVLTGGQDRLKTGFSLLHQGFSDRLFISGVNPDENLKSLLRNQPEVMALHKGQRKELSDKTSLGFLARNTRGNADETTAWVSAHHIKSVRLVTSAYHMPRSLLELHVSMPGVEIVPHPVVTGGLGQEDWWQNVKTLTLTVSEYTKYILAWARIALLG
jgi:uncharacterized SAM-binding protein YcdF (DUF218 family)